MKNVDKYIESGILEMYVLGLTSVEENHEVEKMAASHPEISAEIDAITKALVQHSENKIQQMQPNSTVKPLIMATIDYTERLKNGEKLSDPPLLNEKSTVADYEEWLNRKDLELEKEVEDIEVKLIGYKPGLISAILWIKDSTPYEIHDNEIEKFLIVEGTCDIVTDEKVYSLVPGDYYSIPLHLGHVVKVTSKVPCKAILQRLAA